MQDVLFNLHDIILLLTWTLSVLLAVPMLLKPRGRGADRMLAGFVLTQGFAAVYYLSVYSPVFGPATLDALGVFKAVPLTLFFQLQGLFLLYYVYAICGRSTALSRGDWVFLVAVLALTALDVAATAAFKQQMTISRIPFPTALALLGSVFYGIRALLFLKRHGRAIRERYSNIEEINMLWLSYAAVGFTGVWLLRWCSLFVYSVGGQTWADAVGMAVNYPTIILISWMIVLGLSQSRAPSRKKAEETKRPAESEVGQPSQLRELAAKVERLMVDVKIYQDPNLDVEGLADSAGVSPRSLSSLINGHFGKNFYDFVNHYRVQETQARLSNAAEDNVTIQRIFEDAGFNSKSTFNAFFKKVTGQTPSEYRRTHRGKGSATALE